MRITVEISLYPIAKDYRPPIKDFLARLQSYKELEVVTNAISTQIIGEHARIFDILSKETATTFLSEHPSVFVLKVVGLEQDLQRKY